jgi:bile acid:Na+ symporter, BASS family
MVTPLEQALLAIMLILIMFGMGASLTLRDLILALKRPYGLIVAFLAQFGIMPLVAFTLASLLSLSPAQALGLLIVGCSPGGSTSNLFTYFSKGNLGMGVMMTVNSTLWALLMMPLLLSVYGAGFATDEVQIPVRNIVVNLFILLVPVLLGMGLRRLNANVGALTELFGSVLGIVFILFLLVTWVPNNFAILRAAPWQLYFAAIFVGILGMALGYGFAKALKLHPRNVRTISLETGIQNGPLAITVVLLSFSGELAQEIVFIPALYSLFIVINSSLVTLYFRKANLAEEQKIPDLL